MEKMKIQSVAWTSAIHSSYFDGDYLIISTLTKPLMTQVYPNKWTSIFRIEEYSTAHAYIDFIL